MSSIDMTINNVSIQIKIPKKEIFRINAIFQEQEYHIPNPGHVRTIVDIGANIGLTAIYFRMLYPISRICCFEPCSSSFGMLKENTASFSGIETYRLAVSDYDGKANLKIHKDNSGQNSLTFDGENFTNRETVMVRNAYPLLQEMLLTTVDVLKIDTEGSEVPIMRSLVPMLPQVRHVLVETHSSEDRLAIEALLPTHTLVADRNHVKGFGILLFSRKE
jgi:FkbM family methyltransferase